MNAPSYGIVKVLEGLGFECLDTGKEDFTITGKFYNGDSKQINYISGFYMPDRNNLKTLRFNICDDKGKIQGPSSYTTDQIIDMLDEPEGRFTQIAKGRYQAEVTIGLTVSFDTEKVFPYIKEYMPPFEYSDEESYLNSIALGCIGKVLENCDAMGDVGFSILSDYAEQVDTIYKDKQ
jgi:hypothetical protein